MEKVNGGSMKPAAANDLDFVTATGEALCQSCAFWHARDDLKQGTGVQGGECRFNPPNIFEVTVQTRLGNAKGFQSVWPIVGSGNWCGKHPERVSKVFKLLENPEVMPR